MKPLLFATLPLWLCFSASLAQAKSLSYPRLAFNPTYPLAAGGWRLQFPVGDLLNPVYGTLNRLTGQDRFPTNIANVNEQLTPNNFHDTKVTVHYAVYNADIQYNFLIQKSLLSAPEARRRMVENEIRYSIRTVYYQYLQTLDARRLFDNARSTLRELIRLYVPQSGLRAAAGGPAMGFVLGLRKTSEDAISPHSGGSPATPHYRHRAADSASGIPSLVRSRRYQRKLHRHAGGFYHRRADIPRRRQQIPQRTGAVD